ncbi:MAG: QueT transporter family protein [Clostridia bacterium]|nr:QueT transporter family protein [Clostridia bacterium]
MKKSPVLSVAQAALIAAMYVALTALSNAFGLASGVIQVRISEALCILPYFTPAAIPGLFVGCLISNVLAGGVIWDVIFGSLATLIGAVFTYLLRRVKWLAPVPPIVSNMLIIPFVLRYAYGAPDAIWFMMATVGAGELISAGILGMLLLLALEKRRHAVFGKTQ